MTFFHMIESKMSLIAALFLIVFTGGAGMALLDQRMQGGIKYFLGSAFVGMALGGLGMAFTDNTGIVLFLGLAGMATAPATITWIQTKTIFDVVDEVRRRREGGASPRDAGEDGGDDA